MRLPLLMVAIAACLPLPAGAQTAPMDCTVGPIIKTFGGSKWVVNSCSDGRTVVLMATNDSPAFPCFIKMEPLTEGYTSMVAAKATSRQRMPPWTSSPRCRWRTSRA